MPRRDAAPPIALAIDRALRRPPKSAPSTAPAPETQLGRLARARVGVQLLDAPLRLRERLVEPVALRLEPVADLRRLRVGALLRSRVAARREVVGRLAGPRDELQRAVPLQLERAPLDEVALDVLRRLRRRTSTSATGACGRT